MDDARRIKLAELARSRDERMNRRELAALPYHEWIALAMRDDSDDNPSVWRWHELFAREHLASDHPAWIDLGGEG